MKIFINGFLASFEIVIVIVIANECVRDLHLLIEWSYRHDFHPHFLTE